MKLSIIVPVYKVELFLRRCVDSILAQTFTDFELILVDDGSPDGCPAICDEYARLDNRVRVIHKPNGGLSDARNAGLDIAQGEWIGFVDSDDWISEDMYSRLLDLAARYDPDIAVTGYVNIAEDGQELSRSCQAQSDRLLTRVDFIDNFFPDNKWVVVPCVWNKIYKRHIFSELRFPVGKIYEDSFLQLPILEQCETVAVGNGHGYFYRTQRPGSIMNQKLSKSYFLNMDICLEQYTYYRQKGDARQRAYALDTYLGKYLASFFAAYLLTPDLKKDFLPYKRYFRRVLVEILCNPCTLRMKKLIVIMLYLNVPLAYRLTRYYFPENLPETLR